MKYFSRFPKLRFWNTISPKSFLKNTTYVTEHASLAMDFDASAISSGGLVLQHALTTEMIMRAFCYPSTKKVK